MNQLPLSLRHKLVTLALSLDEIAAESEGVHHTLLADLRTGFRRALLQAERCDYCLFGLDMPRDATLMVFVPEAASAAYRHKGFGQIQFYASPQPCALEERAPRRLGRRED